LRAIPCKFPVTGNVRGGDAFADDCLHHQAVGARDRLYI